MADVAAQVTLFEEPDDYVIENNPDVTYTRVLVWVLATWD